MINKYIEWILDEGAEINKGLKIWVMLRILLDKDEKDYNRNIDAPLHDYEEIMRSKYSLSIQF